MLVLSEALRENYGSRSLFIFYDMKSLERLEITVPKDDEGAVRDLSSTLKGTNPWKRKLKKFLATVYTYGFKTSLLTTPFWALFYFLLYRKIKTTLKRENPHFIFLAVDTSYYPSSIWVRASKSLAIPSALFPFGLANSEAIANDRNSNWAYFAGVPDNFLALSLCPHLGYTFEGKRLILLPAAQALARHFLNLLTPEPWVYNSSNADLVLCESKYTLEQLVTQTTSIANLNYKITGSTKHDFIFQKKSMYFTERQIFFESYDLDPSRPLVLGAVTSDKFATYGHQSEFFSFGEMMEFWLKTITSHSSPQVLLSIHPSEDPGKFQKYESDRIRIAKHPFYKAVVFADLVVNDCSATSRIAVAAGVPVLDYDIYRFNLSFNKLNEFYIYLDDKADFEKTWLEIWNSGPHAFFHEWKDKGPSGYYGQIDGKATRRIIEALQSTLVPRSVR